MGGQTYDTKAVTIGDITLTASKASKDDAAGRLEAVLKWLGDHIVDPGYGQGEGGRPDRPDQGLPGSGARPDQGLPGSQPGPDNTLPGGKPSRPDQSLPDAQPGVDNTLPGGKPSRPDQSLPDAQPKPDQGLPGEELGNFLKENAKEIAAAILKGTACDPAQPKK